MDGMHLPTRDGEVTLTTAGTGGRPDGSWAEFLGEPRLLDPKFATRASRNDNWEELRDLVAPKLVQWDNLDLMRETMARGLVIGLVQSPRAGGEFTASRRTGLSSWSSIILKSGSSSIRGRASSSMARTRCRRCAQRRGWASTMKRFSAASLAFPPRSSLACERPGPSKPDSPVASPSWRFDGSDHLALVPGVLLA